MSIQKSIFRTPPTYFLRCCDETSRNRGIQINSIGFFLHRKLGETGYATMHKKSAIDYNFLWINNDFCDGCKALKLEDVPLFQNTPTARYRTRTHPRTQSAPDGVKTSVENGDVPCAEIIQ